MLTVARTICEAIRLARSERGIFGYRPTSRLMVDDDQSGLTQYFQTITASGSANVKGSYSALIASLSADLEGFFIKPLYGSGFALLMDVAVGAGGSEVVIVPNLYFGPSAGLGGGGFFVSDPIYIPIRIPKGTRVAARCQASSGGLTIKIKMTGIASTLGKGDRGHTTVVDYGTLTGTSEGTLITSPGSANTFSAYAELTASTSLDMKHMLVSVQVETGTSADHAISVAVGAGGSELDVVSNLYFTTASGRGYQGWYSFPVGIPKGTRLSYRARSTGTSQPFRVAVYGIA